MQIKKSASALFLILCLTLIGASAWFLTHPVKVLAATCSATCEGKAPVQCTGDDCVATDGVGCSYTVNGVRKTKNCASSDDDGHEIQ